MGKGVRVMDAYLACHLLETPIERATSVDVRVDQERSRLEPFHASRVGVGENNPTPPPPAAFGND